MGNFSMSYLSWKTAFERIYSKKNSDFSSASFAKFKNEYRQIISARRRDEYFTRFGISLADTLNSGYYDGYGPNSQEVLIPAFMAAYGNKDPRTVTMKFFPSILEMMPNWKITFDGLSKLEWVKKYFNNITLGHAYRSSYNIGSFVSNPYESIRLLDNDLNFIPEFGASSVSINEQFSPLLDINMDWKNSLTTLIEFRRSRTLALSTANNQINEINSKEFVLGAGYRFNQVQIIINQKEYKSDLNVRADISIRDNRTVIRKLSENTDQITAGQRIVTLKTTFDYVLSDRFNLRFFYDQRINNPFVSLSYPTSNTNVGFSVRFTLAQ
jgi:cell surface protein SprA